MIVANYLYRYYLFMKIVEYVLESTLLSFSDDCMVQVFYYIFSNKIFIYFEQTNQFTMKNTAFNFFSEYNCRQYFLLFTAVLQYCIFLLKNKIKLLNAACCSLLRCPPGFVFLQTSLQPYFSLYHEHNCQPDMRT